ncbi:MAG: GTP cyclohydrolase FolE2 [Deferribacterales bacterium]
MKDIQSQRDHRNLDVDRVGIKDIRYPVVLSDRDKGKQSTVARINMYVRLPHNFKGTHMSRFVEILSRHSDDINLYSVGHILDEMKERLDSEEAFIELSFSYFLMKKAPVSRQEAMMDYYCEYFGSSGPEGRDALISVRVPVMTLCPCSKEISKYGAHNQRGYITISVRMKKLMWIEEIIEIAESSASSPVFPLLKREDEKYVTEMSYENPTFVEDVVRNAATKLMAEDRVVWFEVSSENMESIHNHSAYAIITRDKRV